MKINTERLILKNASWEEIQDAKIIRTRIIPSEYNEYPEPEMTLEDEKKWWDNIVCSNKAIILSIFSKDEILLGFLKAFDIKNDICETGIEILNHENYSKGYGYEAFKRFLVFLKEKLNLKSSYVLIHPENKRSIKLFEKLGFVFIGIEKDIEFDYMSFYKMQILF